MAADQTGRAAGDRTPARPRRPSTRATPPTGPVRLLAGVGATPHTLAEHRAEYPAPPRPGRAAHPALAELILRSGLQGRGGAGFPAGRKWQAVASGRGPRFVAANGTEGEPASAKDRLLMSRAPHLVLDGAALAAAAVGAREVVVCVDRHNRESFDVLRQAIAERERAEKGVPM